MDDLPLPLMIAIACGTDAALTWLFYCYKRRYGRDLGWFSFGLKFSLAWVAFDRYEFSFWLLAFILSYDLLALLNNK